MLDETPKLCSQPAFPSLELDEDNKVELLSELGRGGMGVVYQGYQAAFGRKVAVKTLNRIHFGSTQNMQRFRREARTTGALDHPNIVHTYSFGVTADKNPFILMEYVEGHTLADIIAQQGRLTPEQFSSYFSQILDGLAYAHSQGVVHRDLKPANIMVTADGITKIMDFGIAKDMTTDGKTTQSVTATGEILGSPVYMSPEQCRSEEPNPRSDIYAIGCMMFEALEGKPPFTSDAPLELLIKHLNEEPPELSHAGPRMEKLVRSALDKQADKRPVTCEELKTAMLQAINEPQRKRRRRIPQIKLTRKQKWAALVGLLLALSAGALFMPQVKTPETPLEFGPPQGRRTAESEFMQKKLGGPLPQGFDALVERGRLLSRQLGPLRIQKYSEAQIRPYFEDSLRAYMAALKVAPPASQSSRQVEVLRDIGTLYNEVLDHKSSLEWYQKARTVSESKNSPMLLSDRAGLLCSIGAEYECLGQYEKSETVKLRALKLVDDVTNREHARASGLHAYVLETLAMLYASWSKWELSKNYARLSLESRIASHSDESSKICPTRLYGWALFKQNRIKDAFPLLKEAALIAKAEALESADVSNLRNFAESIYYLGLAYASLGNTQKSGELAAAYKQITERLAEGILINIDSINP